MKKKLLLFAFILLSTLTAMAYDAQIDGIYYNFSGTEATVTYGTQYSSTNYSGTVIIPSIVTHSGVIYNVTSIGYQAFYGCSDLSSISIPSSVTSIEINAFNGCSGLTSVTIPNSVTQIGDNAFAYCSGLTSVTIPNSVTSIDYQAFLGCSSLTSVNIPNSVTSIGNTAFFNCTSLTSITIHGSMKTIGKNAFMGCSSLTSVTCKATSVPSTGNGAFNNVPQNKATLYVPASALDDYKKASQWNIFRTIVAIPDAGLRGDANGDGEIGMPDVMFVVNYILGNPAETFNAEAADANLDGEIGMPDVMFIVNYILNGKFPDEE